MRVVALVPAAGRGERLGFGMPKALVPVAGLPLIVHSLRALLASGVVHYVVVAGPADDLGPMQQAIAAIAADADRIVLVRGGDNRTASVRLAMRAAASRLPRADVLLVHDAARAFTPPELIRSVAEMACRLSAVVPVLPVLDTIRQVDSDGAVTATPDRAALRVVQTPQGFAAGLLRRAYDAIDDGDSATDDAGLVERLGERVHTVPGHPNAVKITTPFDLAVAEAVLAQKVEP